MGSARAVERRRRWEVWGRFIDEELTARGMPPAQLARYANVDASTVGAWRQQKALPKLQAVLGVARCFQLPVALVAERAGILLAAEEETTSRAVSDPQWRDMLAVIDQLSDAELGRLKAVLGRLVRGAVDDAG